MNVHKLKIEIVITDEDVNDIIDSALRGKRYWSTEDYIKNDEQVPEGVRYNEALTNGFKYRIKDDEEGKWHTLTLSKFLKALSNNPRFDYENYDQSDAEQILQEALFGEAIYG